MQKHPELLDSLIAEVSASSCEEVHVQLPRFKLETALDLIPPLQALGVNTIFENNADLSGMWLETF